MTALERLEKKKRTTNLELCILWVDDDKTVEAHSIAKKAAEELFNLRRKLENAQHEIKHFMGDCDCDEIANP